MGRCRPSTCAGVPGSRSLIAATAAPYPAGTTMTASSLPTCISEIASLLGRVLEGDARLRAANSARSCAELRRTRRRPPSRASGATGPPWKMRPNSTMKTSGKASVQKSAARSRMKLLMLATVRAMQGVHGRRLSRAALDRSGRGRRPRAWLAGRRGSGGFDAAGLAAVSSAADRRGDVDRVEQHVVVVVLHRATRRQRPQHGVVERRRSRRTGPRAPGSASRPARRPCPSRGCGRGP